MAQAALRCHGANCGYPWGHPGMGRGLVTGQHGETTRDWQGKPVLPSPGFSPISCPPPSAKPARCVSQALLSRGRLAVVM